MIRQINGALSTCIRFIHVACLRNQRASNATRVDESRPNFVLFTPAPVKLGEGWTFTFAICHRPPVCVSSVTFVHPTQAIEIFGNVSTPCGTMAIHDLCVKILRRSSQRNPFVWGVKPKRGSKNIAILDFSKAISETMQDMI